MAHLSFEYSSNLESSLDMMAFCAVMRDVMHDSGVFPLGGIRVRGTRVDVHAVASGEPAMGFLDMTLRMGQGRDKATRQHITRLIYDTAETWLSPHLADMPFALSLEIMEINKAFSEKRYNNLHDFLQTDR